jgi:hypothetical protein
MMKKKYRADYPPYDPELIISSGYTHLFCKNRYFAYILLLQEGIMRPDVHGIMIAYGYTCIN